MRKPDKVKKPRVRFASFVVGFVFINSSLAVWYFAPELRMSISSWFYIAVIVLGIWMIFDLVQNHLMFKRLKKMRLTPNG